MECLATFFVGELIQGASVRPELAGVADEQHRPFDYVLRTVIAVVLAVSWLATLTRSTDSLDMAVLADPFRHGLQNQWCRVTG